MSRNVVAAVAAAIVCAVPATAAPRATHFQNCDGFLQPPKPKNLLQTLFLVKGGSIGAQRLTNIALGRNGVTACDTALVDPLLTDGDWMRRVSLLQARAVHQLASGQTEAALADLAKAEAAAREPNDPYYRRSIGLGNDIVRAFALRAQERHGEADALIEKVLKERPYNRQIAIALLALTPDLTAVVAGEPALLPVARLQPKLIDTIFAEHFRRRDFAAMAALFQHLQPPTRTLDRGAVSRLSTDLAEDRNELVSALFMAERHAELAYARAALGDAAGARAELTRAESSVNQIRALPPVPTGEKEGKKARTVRLMNTLAVGAAAKHKERLAQWKEMVELRIKVGEGETPDSFEQLPKLIPNPAALDLLISIHARRPDFAGADGVIAELEKKTASEPFQRSEALQLLWAGLPYSEAAEKISTFRKANSPFAQIMWGGVSGFKTKANPDGSVTVSFTSTKSNGTVVEEMALLRAADYAREQGKNGLVIKSRADFQRTIVYGYYGVASGPGTPDGYSTDLVIEPVDKANLPPLYRSAPWRVLDAQAVIDRLEPIYRAPPTAPAAQSAASR
jgi:hypothetical protein